MIYKKVLEHMKDIFIFISLEDNNCFFPFPKEKYFHEKTIFNECKKIDSYLYHEKLKKWYSKDEYVLNINDKKYFVEEFRDITNFKEKEELLKIDQVTGLSIRKVIVEQIMNEINAKKEGYLVLSDIDHFKNVNDTFGHDVGDYVLKEVGTILNHSMEKEELVGRFGGEEFIFFLKEKPKDKIFDKLSNMNHLFHEISLPSPDFLLSMSFGFTRLDGTKSFDQLLKNADEALYYAKENGRNQSICFEDIKKDKA